jgi:acyl-CoA thioesterase-1
MLARRVAVAACLLFAACSGFLGNSRTALVQHHELAKETEPAKEPDPGPRTLGVPRVVFLGDSLTFGAGLESRLEAWPAVLGQRLLEDGVRIEVVNAGVSGDTTRGGLVRLPALLELKPDVLVVALGGNDAAHGEAVGLARENLNRIVSQAQKAGAKVLLAGLHLPPNLESKESGNYESLWQDIGTGLDVPVVPDMMEGVFGAPGMVQADGVHPTTVGQQRVATNVEPYLRDVLKGTRLEAPAIGTH